MDECRICEKCPTLAEKFTADITAARKELADSLAMYQDTPECFLRWRKSDEKLDGLVKSLFTEWIKQKLWTQEFPQKNNSEA